MSVPKSFWHRSSESQLWKLKTAVIIESTVVFITTKEEFRCIILENRYEINL